MTVACILRLGTLASCAAQRRCAAARLKLARSRLTGQPPAALRSAVPHAQCRPRRLKSHPPPPQPCAEVGTNGRRNHARFQSLRCV
eukprot:366000-Chlamydomonas_euryale.AAC.47